MIRSSYMTDSDQHDDQVAHQLEIIRLLDDRYRLREDPKRRLELERTHARLRERLRQARENDERRSSTKRTAS